RASGSTAAGRSNSAGRRPAPRSPCRHSRRGPATRPCSCRSRPRRPPPRPPRPPASSRPTPRPPRSSPPPGPPAPPPAPAATSPPPPPQSNGLITAVAGQNVPYVIVTRTPTNINYGTFATYGPNGVTAATLTTSSDLSGVGATQNVDFVPSGNVTLTGPVT